MHNNRLILSIAVALGGMLLGLQLSRMNIDLVRLIVAGSVGGFVLLLLAHLAEQAERLTATLNRRERARCFECGYRGKMSHFKLDTTQEKFNVSCCPKCNSSNTDVSAAIKEAQLGRKVD